MTFEADEALIESLVQNIEEKLMALAAIWGPQATLLYVVSIGQRMQDELDEAAT